MVHINRKGQLFSGDIAIATMVFLASLSIAFFLWNIVGEDMRRGEMIRDMESMGSGAVENLIRNPGVPEDWNQYNVITPGLSSEDRVINATKLKYFISLMNASSGYEDNKHLLGTGVFDFYFNMSGVNGSVVRVDGIRAIAGRYPEDELYSLTLTRAALFNNETVLIKFTIWSTERVFMLY